MLSPSQTSFHLLRRNLTPSGPCIKCLSSLPSSVDYWLKRKFSMTSLHWPTVPRTLFPSRKHYSKALYRRGRSQTSKFPSSTFSSAWPTMRESRLFFARSRVIIAVRHPKPSNVSSSWFKTASRSLMYTRAKSSTTSPTSCM